MEVRGSEERTRGEGDCFWEITSFEFVTFENTFIVKKVDNFGVRFPKMNIQKCDDEGHHL